MFRRVLAGTFGLLGDGVGVGHAVFNWNALLCIPLCVRRVRMEGVGGVGSVHFECFGVYSTVC